MIKKVLSIILLCAAVLVSSCKKEETSVKVGGVSLDKPSLQLAVGENYALKATVTPENATDKTVTWSSSDNAVATVSETGNVIAIKVGDAMITATSVSDNSKKAGCAVTVTEKTIAVTEVKLDKENLPMTVGEKFTLTASVSPENATNKSLTWSSSDESVATVSDKGEITAVKAGDATITVTSVSDNSKKADCVVTVTEKPIAVTNVTLDKNELPLLMGEKFTLTASVTPEDASNKNLTWSSSDESVATVSESGEITAVKEGSAMITVKSEEDPSVTDECSVTVSHPLAALIGSYTANGEHPVSGAVTWTLEIRKDNDNAYKIWFYDLANLGNWVGDDILYYGIVNEDMTTISIPIGQGSEYVYSNGNPVTLFGIDENSNSIEEGNITVSILEEGKKLNFAESGVWCNIIDAGTISVVSPGIICEKQQE